MKTYQKHLESTLSYGETVSATRRPIFRSSAIFPVVHTADYTSRILFMGYWLLKRNIPEVQLLVTLRDEDGTPIVRKSIIVDTPKARSIEIAPLLGEAGRVDAAATFVGSLELEIFATRDLVFPYPAFVLNYIGADFVTSVHTAGRVYNDIDDLLENDAYAVPESGFDILSDEAAEPFFSFVNGPYSYPDAAIDWTVVGEDRSTTSGTIRLGDVKPYQTIYVELAKEIDLHSILHGGKGTIKLSHQLKGFFPRLIAGNHRTKPPAASITHSYYDSSAVADQGAYWARRDDSLNDSSIFVPYFSEGDEYTDLVFYPIYSPSSFSVDLVFYDGYGKVLGERKEWKRLESSPDALETVSLAKVVADSLPPALRARVRGINIVKNWHDRERIPTRLKFGLNVGLAHHALDLPTNICFNSELGNPAVLKKPRTFKWSPILNHGRSVVVVTNSSTRRVHDTPALLQLAFFRERDDLSLERTVMLPPFGQLRLDIQRDAELKDFLGDETGWVTIVSDNPVIKAWYFDFGDSGVVGGDHCF